MDHGYFVRSYGEVTSSWASSPILSTGKPTDGTDGSGDNQTEHEFQLKSNTKNPSLPILQLWISHI